MPTLSPDVVARRLDDRFVVVNLATNRIYELNPSASALWELLDAETDLSEVERRLCERFDVEPDELRREIDGVLEVMAEAGLITDVKVATAA